VTAILAAASEGCAHVLAALFAERRQAEARLQEALAAGAVLAFECNPVSGLVKRSDNAAQIMGFDPQQPLTAAQFLARIHPDDLARFEAHNNRAGVDGPATVTFRFIRPDGREVWLEETSRAEFDTTGRPMWVKGLTRDVTRRKQSEKRQELLSAELDHRVKNVLARVAAVVRHTRRRSGTSDEFVHALDGRIQSIAAAHALLRQNRWDGVSLADLMRQQLAPYTTDGNTAISGPEVTLTSAQTQPVATVVHELVTNAAKHGALSGPDGRVSVSWDLGADQAVILTITWHELGGSPVTAPVQSGYGLTLIRDLIPHELGGAVHLTSHPMARAAKLKFPLGEREDRTPSMLAVTKGARANSAELPQALRSDRFLVLEKTADGRVSRAHASRHAHDGVESKDRAKTDASRDHGRLITATCPSSASMSGGWRRRPLLLLRVRGCRSTTLAARRCTRDKLTTYCAAQVGRGGQRSCPIATGSRIRAARSLKIRRPVIGALHRWLPIACGYSKDYRRQARMLIYPGGCVSPTRKAIK
jgi:PAS domain S-box-containing protein